MAAEEIEAREEAVLQQVMDTVFSILWEFMKEKQVIKNTVVFVVHH